MLKPVVVFDMKYEGLSKLITGNVILDAPMASYTTYRIGGPADCLVEAASVKDVVATVGYAKSNALPLTVIGNGSNLLVSDKGIEGIVLCIGNSLNQWQIRGNQLIAGAGCLLSQLARETAKLGYEGLQWAAGIPASLGGAAYMNAGAFGHNFYETLTGVTAVSLDGKVIYLEGEALNSSYRTTALMTEGYIATELKIRLRQGDKEALTATVEDILARRRDKQPLNYPSCGSVFKNPEGSHAGYLIEKCDLRGKRIGNVEISTKHGNFFLNLGDGTAEDVCRLINYAIDVVKREEGYILEPEVRIIGREVNKLVSNPS